MLREPTTESETMARPKRHVTGLDIAMLEASLKHLRDAAVFAGIARAPQARKAIQRAIKSTDGAVRYARRLLREARP